MAAWISNPNNAMAFWTIAIAALCAVSCGVVGCFLLLQRASLFGDAVSHSVLPGIVLAFLITGSIRPGPMLISAAIMGAITAAMAHLLGKGGVSEDAGLGVTFVTLFALGVVLLANFAHRVDLDVGCVLLGSLEQAFLVKTPIPGTSLQAPRAFVTLAIVAVIIVGATVVFWKELKISTFDPALATANGFHAEWVRGAVLMAAALVAVASFEAVGSILVIGMLIVPAATARLLVDRLGSTVLAATLIGVACAPLGYFADLRYGTGTAPAIVIAAGGLFMLALLFAPRQGLLQRAIALLALRVRIAGEDIMAVRYRQEESPGRAIRPEAPTSALVRWLAKWRLHRRGLTFPTSGELTADGRLEARSLVRSHRLWERYLDEHFDLPLDHLHDPASRIEHFIGPALQKDIEKEIRQTAVDPHGKPIPEVVPPQHPVEE